MILVLFKLRGHHLISDNLLDQNSLRCVICTQVTLFSESIRPMLYSVYFPSQEKEITVTCKSHSVQFSSVAQSCPTFCDPMNPSMSGLPVHHQLMEFTQTHVHGVSDAIQPSHPLSSPSPPAPNPSQHQSLFQWVNSSHEVAKVLELQL